MENKKVLRSSFIGFVLLLLAMLVTGIFGISDMMDGGSGTLYGHTFTYGLRATIGYFINLWKPASFVHETSFIGLAIVFVAIVSMLFLIIASFAKKKPVFVLPALFFGASLGYSAFVLILVVPMVQLGVLKDIPQLAMAGVACLTAFAIYLEYSAVKKLFKKNEVVANKKADKAEPVKEEVNNGLSEEEVNAIVEKYLSEHVNELHPDGAAVVNEQPVEEPVEEHVEEKAEEPVEEEPVEEEPAEEEQVEEDVQDDEEDGDEGEEEVPAGDNVPVGIASRGKRRRASFETRLKNSEFDLRHKYYDLRDYIKWYGLRNRISIPGDTFSYKRQRYVFLTIVGKHIRVYLGLDPNDYSDSTIPVEATTAKKYEDLPCLLRVKSDLSYRRAKKLVDDLMSKVGLEKPDEDAPKETQKQD